MTKDVLFFSGYMKPGGIPDSTKAARFILKDFVQGKLLFCQAPPNVQQVLLVLGLLATILIGRWVSPS